MRLDFALPEFTRIIWASPRARQVWEPRIRAISNAWHMIERFAVIDGLKTVTLQSCSPEELIELNNWTAGKNLIALAVDRHANSLVYSNATTPVTPGEAWSYKVVIGRPDLASAFIGAYREHDDEQMGHYLGFPDCCRAFFTKYWQQEAWRDLTYPMLGPTLERDHDVGGYNECNVLLRHLGVRAVSHLPCSFGCTKSAEMGQELFRIGRRAGYEREMAWLADILSWPIGWSSLHGIAIVTTPILKVVSSTTALAYKVTIRRKGTRYPVEGAIGTEFPFQNIHRLTVHAANNYADNGFMSEETMDRAHDVIKKAAAFAPFSHAKILDLGCGNGRLLEKLVELVPWAIPCGVENNGVRFERASERLKDRGAHLFNCSITDDHYWDGPYGLVLLSVARLKELGREGCQPLLARIAQNSEYLIHYSYEGITDLAEHGVLDHFELQVGLGEGPFVVDVLKSRR
jgi:hypothetical protein